MHCICIHSNLHSYALPIGDEDNYRNLHDIILILTCYYQNDVGLWYCSLKLLSTIASHRSTKWFKIKFQLFSFTFSRKSVFSMNVCFNRYLVFSYSGYNFRRGCIPPAIIDLKTLFINIK